MQRMLNSAVFVTVMAVPAAAQQLTFVEAEIDYDTYFDDSSDFSETTLAGDVELSIDRFVLGAEIARHVIDFNGDDLSVQNFGIFAGYQIVPEIFLGAGLTSLALDSGNSEVESSGYEVFGQYETGQFGTALSYAVPDSDADDGLSVLTVSGLATVSPDVAVSALLEQVEDADENFYAVALDYEAGPVDLRAYTQGVTGDNGSFIGLSGAYDVANQIALIGAIASSDSLELDTTTLSVGAQYSITNDFVAEASIGVLDIEDEELTTFGFKISSSQGDRKRLDRTIRDAFADDRDTALGPLDVDFGFVNSAGGL